MRDIIPGRRRGQTDSELIAGVLLRSGALLDVQGAGAVLAKLAIPSIAIARHPCVEMLRDKVNPGHEQKPCDQLPAGQ